jgi:hypothetical protein
MKVERLRSMSRTMSYTRHRLFRRGLYIKRPYSFCWPTEKPDGE